MSFKRIVPVLLIVCLFVGLLPSTALAADVIKVAEWWIEGGTTYTEYAESNNVWGTFESTWNAAMEAADKNHSKMMHFKLYTDWNADSDGDFSDYTFSSGAGFNYWTIYIPDGARVTLDLNGHMINRRLTDDTSNGEVIYVDEGAYLVIEDSDPDVVHPGEVGTDGLWRPGGSGSHKISGGIITGGYSSNGAGGIHMMEDSHVVLNLNCEDGYVPTVTVTDKNGNDTEFSLVKQETGYRIIIPEIGPTELGDFFTVHLFEDGKEAMTLRTCALSYAHSILQSSARSPELKNAMAALAEYYFAAIDYAGQ